ncbi:MAG: MFS transporter [Thermoprotei archaeon]|nr:MAG: MFS transporter [Thermoprotei archaeon]
MRIDRVLLLSMPIWAAVALSVGLSSFVLKGFQAEVTELPAYISGLLASSTLIGMLIGASTSGLLGDRIGRKTSLILYIALQIIGNMFVSLAHDPSSFILFRLIAGIGAGGILPIVSTLVAEFSLPKDRGSRIAFLESAWSYGWLLMVALAVLYFRAYGWRYYAIISSYAVILLSLPVFLLPESPRYLLAKGRIESAKMLAKKYKIELPEIPVIQKLGIKDGLKILLSREHRRVTILLWITWFAITMGYYGIFIWFPRLLAQHGIEIGFGAVSEFIRNNYYTYIVITTIFQIPGYYSAVYFVEKIGRVKTLSIYLVVTGLSAFLLAFTTQLPLFLLAGMALNFFDLGAWAALYAYTPEQYPTHTRVLGSGWAAAWGRIGGIIGPYIVPFLGAWTTVFAFFAIINILGGIVALGGRELRGMEMIELKK